MFRGQNRVEVVECFSSYFKLIKLSKISLGRFAW